MHSYTYKWRQMSSLYLNVSHLNHSLQWFDLGMKQETVLWVKVLEHGVRNFRMRFSYFSYSSSFSIKTLAPDAKTQKIKPGPIRFFLCRTKVSQTVCKHDWYNIRSYLFFNEWTFQTQCAMVLSHWIIHPIDPFRNEARHSLYKSLNPSLKLGMFLWGTQCLKYCVQMKVDHYQHIVFWTFVWNQHIFNYP